MASEILEDEGDIRELASGPKVRAYYQRVLKKFVETGRVQHFGMVSYRGEDADGRSTFAPILAPESVTTVQAGTVVDATYMNVEVPSIRPPVFPVAPGVQLKPLNALFQLQREVTQPSRFAVIGAGKTGMDAVLFLLNHGVEQSRIVWIMPNDSWLLDRDQLFAGADEAQKIRESATLRPPPPRSL